jgi:hypothetical protein
MTRPTLDFLIRLHKNGESPYDKVIRKTFKIQESERETNIQTNKQID